MEGVGVKQGTRGISMFTLLMLRRGGGGGRVGEETGRFGEGRGGLSGGGLFLLVIRGGNEGTTSSAGRHS